MNDTSSSRADGAAPDQTMQRDILVWDLPVRMFHWLMVLCFAGAWLTAESERWRLVHVTLGYTMAGLLAFRVLWGFFGTRHARFASFVRGPKAVGSYLRSLVRGEPEHHVGHNPAGALAIVALLGLTGLVAATGWGAYNDMGGEWFEEVHEAVASVMLGLVILHVAAVVISSRLHGENLVASMIDGYKLGAPEQGIRRAWRGLAIAILAAVLGFWWLQWQASPADAAVQREMHGTAAHKDHERRHDDD